MPLNLQNVMPSRSAHTVPPGSAFPSLPLCQAGRPIRLLRGETLYEAGTSAREIYRVTTGSIRISRLLSDGRRLITAFALPGEVFGIETSHIRRQFAEASIEAVIIAYALPEIDRRIDHEPLAGRYWLRMALDELELAQERCILLGRKTASERVASFLLDLDDRFDRHDNILPLPMSRYDIADYLGLTAETVSRALSDLRRRGIVADEDPHRLWLLDRPALRREAGDQP